MEYILKGCNIFGTICLLYVGFKLTIECKKLKKK